MREEGVNETKLGHQQSNLVDDTHKFDTELKYPFSPRPTIFRVASTPYTAINKCLCWVFCNILHYPLSVLCMCRSTSGDLKNVRFSFSVQVTLHCVENENTRQRVRRVIVIVCVCMHACVCVCVCVVCVYIYIHVVSIFTHMTKRQCDTNRRLTWLLLCQTEVSLKKKSHRKFVFLFEHLYISLKSNVLHSSFFLYIVCDGIYKNMTVQKHKQTKTKKIHHWL